tara:strand:+ start:2384 stop:2590 length:207 start_codon:yes stop_codon:yes gene_type:complete
LLLLNFVGSHFVGFHIPPDSDPDPDEVCLLPVNISTTNVNDAIANMIKYTLTSNINPLIIFLLHLIYD